MEASEFRDGWLLVIAAWCVGFLVDGVLFSFGVFLIEFLDDLGDSRGSTTFVGSIGIGVFFMLGPISGSLADKYGSRPLIITGSVISFAGFLSSVFVTTLPVMCLTYGLLGGAGFGLMLLPANACIIKHFTKRRALANGIAVCGSGIGTFTINILASHLISEFGWRMALLIISGILLNGIPCGLLLVSPRQQSFEKQGSQTRPLKQESTTTNEKGSEKSVLTSAIQAFKCIVQENVRLLKDKGCLCIMVSTFFVGLAFTIPFSFLPDQAVKSGMNKSKASWLVSSIGISSVIGRFLMGWIGDKISRRRRAMFETTVFLQGISVALMPLLPTFRTKLILTCLFGLSYGGYVMLIPVIMADEFGSDRVGKSNGLVLLAVGISSFFATPLAGWIFDVSHSYNISFYVAGGEFWAAALCILVPRILLAIKGKREIIASTYL